MSEDSGRLEVVVSEGRVKLHIFDPSKRKIWSVVGRDGEHWIDPESKFCSCPGFYFGPSSGRTSCYHLDSASMAIGQGKFETVKFADDEFSIFLAGLISDL